MQGGFRDRPRETPKNPRRVRGGIKSEAKAWPPSQLSWLSHSFYALCAGGADPASLEKAFDFCRRGQTRRLEVLPGRVTASVQGPRYAPNEITIEFPVFSHQQWEKLIEVISEQPAVAAKLLASEMPRSIDQLFSSCGVQLLPSTRKDLTITESYPEDDQEDHYWLCPVMLATEMIEHNPFLVFTLRGLAFEELEERLRQRRSASTTLGRSATLLGQPRAAGDSPPLEEVAGAFWTLGPSFDAFDTTPRRSEVTHPMLRRLGASPFAESQFPLVGLLATCYDLISGDAVEGFDEDVQGPTDADESADQSPAPSEPQAPVRTAAEVMAARIQARRASKPKAKSAARKPAPDG